MSGNYLLDNNAISSFINNQLSENGMIFMSQVIDKVPIISVITEIEALSWINEDKTKEKYIISFVKDSVIISLSPKIVSQCVKIRRSKKIKTPDAILAATAIVYNLTLISNDSIFKSIKDLKTIDPFSIL
jgi:predicted nucleic acid-binding protein